MATNITAQYQLTFKDLASRGMLGVARSAKNLVGKLGSVTGVVAKIGGAFSALSGVVVGSKLIGVQREFDVLNSSLLTAMGSTEKAAAKFKELNDFAAKTPYTLSQSVRGFVQLKNLGLDPSLKSMEAYGDMASAMGKDLSQMIEAVADAATFEFERLKEFGITSSQNAKKNTVSFRFQGKVTTVKRDAKNVQKYILGVAKNFQGAMANRMATLDGAFANFGQNFNNVLLKISQSGIGDAVASVLNKASRHFTEFVDYMDSDEGKKKVVSIVNTIKKEWGNLKEFLGPIIEFISKGISTILYDLNTLKIALDIGSASRAFWIFPKSIQLIVIAVEKAKEAFQELGQWINKMIQIGEGIKDWAIENKEVLIALGVGVGTVGGVFLVFTGIMTAVTIATTAASVAMGVLGTIFAVITSPITLVLGIIAGGIALFTYFYRNNEKFAKGINALWKFTAEAFSHFIDAFSKLGKIFDRIMNAIFDGIAQVFYSFVNTCISRINMLIRVANSISSHLPGGDSFQINEFEKIGIEHSLKANQAAESRAIVAKSLISLAVEVSGNVDGVKNFQANVTPDSYKSTGGKNAFVVK